MLPLVPFKRKRLKVIKYICGYAYNIYIFLINVFNSYWELTNSYVKMIK